MSFQVARSLRVSPETAGYPFYHPWANFSFDGIALVAFALSGSRNRRFEHFRATDFPFRLGSRGWFARDDLNTGGLRSYFRYFSPYVEVKAVMMMVT